MQYDAVRANRWHNFDLLEEAGNSDAQAELIIKSLNYFFDTNGKKNQVRIHESGDFYNNEYLAAWIKVAKTMPKIEFYAYTKSIPYVKAMEGKLKDVPNFSITLSSGGRKDAEIEDLDIKQAKVFNTPEEVLEAGLIVDLDDTLAKEKGGKEKNFALLVHGTQGEGVMSQNKRRNETFMNYWKYKDDIDRYVFKGIDRGDKQTEYDVAKEAYKQLDNILKSKKVSGSRRELLSFLKTQTNYVMKYITYDFDEELINILPKKYKPKLTK